MKTNNLNLLIICLVLCSIIFICGCKSTQQTVQQSEAYQKVIDDCVALCNLALQQGIDLTNGPCLSELHDVNATWQHADWVCDVAHWPRQDVDNLAENQCQAYRQGNAKHFVELTPTCEFIRAI